MLKNVLVLLIMFSFNEERISYWDSSIPKAWLEEPTFHVGILSVSFYFADLAG